MVSRKALKAISWMFALVLAVVVAAAGFYLGYSYVLSQNSRFAQFEKSGSTIGPSTPNAVMIVIPRGSDTKDIAKILEEKKVVENAFLFTLLSKFNGFDGSYLAGTHFVLKDMTYDEIMYMLSLDPHTVRVTFPEGLSYKKMKEKLRASGVYFDEVVLDSLVANPAKFIEYPFIQDIPASDTRDLILQGYLFPDTYEFDMNADEETILRTFLDNTRNKLIPEYYKRAKEIGMSMDEVITLSSIVQNETVRLEEMSTVAGVFFNRLRRKEPTERILESCAVLNYLREEQGLDRRVVATDEDIRFPSPYNTYQNAGLPPGPICNPGSDAIRATLWPDKHGYFFFVARGDGTSAFAATFKEHLANVAKYVK